MPALIVTLTTLPVRMLEHGSSSSDCGLTWNVGGRNLVYLLLHNSWGDAEPYHALLRLGAFLRRVLRGVCLLSEHVHQADLVAAFCLLHRHKLVPLRVGIELDLVEHVCRDDGCCVAVHLFEGAELKLGGSCGCLLLSRGARLHEGEAVGLLVR